MARQKPTNPDTTERWSLTPQQETAVDLIAGGKTLTDTAKAINVTRQTVSEWVNRHPGFQAALNSRREELWRGMQDTLQGLLPKALEVLKAELEGEAPLQAAVHVLKACGLYGVCPPWGETDPEKIAEQRAAEQQRRTEEAEHAQEEAERAKRRRAQNLMLERLLYPPDPSP